jgi:LacI family transcriptional regulator
MGFLPTIKDVAAAAGVHFTTVSMALRGDPRLRPETRNRILAAALRTGYQRNPVSEALSRHRRPVTESTYVPRIAYLANRSPENGFYTPSYVRALLKGVREKAQMLGYGFEVLFIDHGHYNSRSLYRYLKKNGINGLILGAFEPGRHELELPWSEFCVVQIDSRHLRSAFTFVSNDQLHAVRLSFRRLWDLGYRRIGLAVGAKDEIVTANLPVCGYLLEQATVHQRRWIEPLFFPPNVGAATAAKITAAWVKRESPDAVVCNWASIRRLLHASGVACPEKVACACMCLRQPVASLAGVVANLELVGSQLTAMLAALLQSEQYGVPVIPTSTYVEGFWHDGSSAPRRK